MVDARLQRSRPPRHAAPSAAAEEPIVDAAASRSSASEPESDVDGPDEAFVAEIHDLLYELLLAVRGHVESIAAGHELSGPQFLVLRSLESPRAMRELAALLRCDASNVTGIIDRLEERGLVERQAAPGDRRVKRVALTPEGRRVREDLQRRALERSPAVTGLSPAERFVLRDLLSRLTSAPATPPPTSASAAGPSE